MALSCPAVSGRVASAKVSFACAVPRKPASSSENAFVARRICDARISVCWTWLRTLRRICKRGGFEYSMA